MEEWLEWRSRWTRYPDGADADGRDIQMDEIPKTDADEVREPLGPPVQPAAPPPLSMLPGLEYLSNQHLASWLKVAATEPAPDSPAKKSSGSAKEFS